MLRIRLVAVGRDRSEDTAAAYPDVTQLLWAEMLAFICGRFHRYRQQKTQMDQSDAEGRKIKRLADRSNDATDFVGHALRLMGVRNGSIRSSWHSSRGHGSEPRSNNLPFSGR